MPQFSQALAVFKSYRVHNVRMADRKSTRLNSSHTVISYAVFCLKKKKSSASKKNHIINCLFPHILLTITSQRQASERLGTMKQLTCWLLLRYFLKSIHCGAVSFRPGPQNHLSQSYQLFCQNFHRVPYLPMNFYYWQINRILI